MKRKLLFLAILLQAVLFGHAQIAISTGLNAALTAAEPVGNVDPYWVIASSPYPPNTPAKVSSAYPSQWQPTPIAGTSAGWINNTGFPNGVMMPGIYVFERDFNVSANTPTLACNFSVAHTGILLSLELIDPSAVATSLTVVPTSPNYLSQLITTSVAAPQAGTWKIRTTIRYIIDIGGFMLSGNILGFACQNTFLQGLANCGGSAPGIFENPAGGFFATGLSQNKTVIVKVDASGNVLWSRGLLLGTGFFQILDLKVLPNGDLIGIANNQTNTYESNIFKINSTATAFSWVKNNQNIIYTQLHLLNNNEFIVTGSNNGGFTHLEKRSIATGNIPGSGYTIYGEGGDYYSTLFNGNLYGTCRRYYNASGDFRASVFSHNATTGAFQWQNSIISEGNTSISTQTRMYPVAPAIDNPNMVVLSSGDLVGFDTYATGPVELVAAQTTLTGSVNWTNQYAISGYDQPHAMAIKSSASGYYMIACLYLPSLGDFGYTVVIKTDKSGTLLWAKRLGISGKNIATGAVENNGYLTLSMASDSYSPNELMLIKLDPLGNSSNGCSFIQDIDVAVKAMPIVQNVRNYNASPKTLAANFVGTVFSNLTPVSQTYCKTNCPPVSNVTITGNSVISPGGVVTLTAEGFVGNYSWNTGENTQTIDVYKPGQYCVTVRNGDEIAEDCFTVSSSGDEGDGLRKVNSLQQKTNATTSTFSLSPNPTSNSVTLTVGKVPTVNATVAISDQYGKRVHQTVLAAGTKQLNLQIAHLPAGIYTVTVFFADKKTATVKLVKQ